MENRYLAALQEQFNLLALSAMAALAAAMLDPLPLLVGLVAEAGYLTVVPNSKWYARRLARGREAAIRARREQLQREILPRLGATLQTRFARLEAVRAEINQQAQGQLWMHEITGQLEFLSEKWLQFALKHEQLRVYLAEVRPDGLNDGASPREPDGENARATVAQLQESYSGDIAAIEAQLARESDEDTRAVLRQRLELLRRRRDFGARIGQVGGNLAQQLALIEESFGLIRDELWARPPARITDEIKAVVSQTRIMGEILQEMAPYERMLDSL